MKQIILASALLLAFTMTAVGQDLGSNDSACKPRSAIYGSNKYQCTLPITTLEPSQQEDRIVGLIVTGPNDIEWQLTSLGYSPLFTGGGTNIVIIVNGDRRWEIPTTRVTSSTKNLNGRLGEGFTLNVTRDVALEIASAKTATIEAGTRKAVFPAIWQPGIKDAIDYMDYRSGKFTSSQKEQFATREKISSCSLDDIEIKVIKAKFVNDCKTRECWQLKGVAVLTNKCSKSLIVAAKIIGYGPGMKPLAVRDFYPASSNSIPPGEFVFSLDGMLEYDPEIYVFYVKAIGGRIGQ